MEDTRRALSPNTIVVIATTDGNSFPIKIIDVIGYGGSCIVYRGTKAVFAGKKEITQSVIIKELYPCGMGIVRNEDNSLDIPREKYEDFGWRKARFGEGQSKHSRYFEMVREKSSLPAAFLYGEANNTMYAVSFPSAGYTLSDIDRESLKLYRVATIMESLCRAILPIHQAGKLYMDCKPDNIFFYAETLQDHVYLFDFDTVIPEKYEEHKEEYQVCSYSIGWRAPEQEYFPGRGYKHPENISFCTDIFSMGLIFLWLLTGNNPEKDEMKRNEIIKEIQEEQFDFQNQSELCRTASTEAVALISQILKKMLEPNARERKKLFDTKSSLYVLIPEFQKLYALTIGSDSYYDSIYEAIGKTQNVFIEQSKQLEEEMMEQLSFSEKNLKEEIKKHSVKEMLFGTTKKKMVTCICLVVMAILVGVLVKTGETIVSKIWKTNNTILAANMDDHLLLELNNANHQYEVGLENWRRQDYNRAKRDIANARDEMMKKVSLDNIEVAKINNSLGCLLLDMGQYEMAYDYLNDGYVTFKDTYGETSIEARAVLFSISQHDYYVGDLETALQTIQRIIDCSDASKDRVLLTAVNHFKAMILEAKGEYEESILVYQEVLDLYDEYLQDGSLVGELSEYTRNQSLPQNEQEAYTNMVEWIALTYCNMGQTMLHRGETSKAQQILQSGLDICLNNIYIGTKSLLTAKLYMNMAKVKGELSDLQGAIEDVDLAMRIERNLFDFEEVYPGLVEVYDVYGNLLYKKGEEETARQYLEMAVQLSQNTYGDNHRQTALAYDAIGVYELKAQNYNAAESAFESAIEINRNILCLNHPDSVTYYVHMAAAQEKLGKTKEAKESLQQAQSICEKLGFSQEYTNDVLQMEINEK